MGGGHNGAARELARRLRCDGHEADIVEYLDTIPYKFGWMLRRVFLFQLRHARWSYDLVYRWSRLFGWLLAPLTTSYSLKRLQDRIDTFDADVVVSTYPISSLAVGRLNLAGRINAPVITFLTDFAVHPLWVHDGVDLHLAIHPNAATEATSRGANLTLCPGALVHPRFRDSTGRDETRAALGLALGDVVVLIVAGSWGVGDVDETVADISRDTCLKTIVVCGEDEPLRRKLTAEGKGIVLGWTDNMANLMAAADILVENAGGLTSLEAMAAGLPVITYRPIPGHGRDNAAAMDRAGVSWHAHNRQELFVALERLSYNSPERNHMRTCAAAMFHTDPAAAVTAFTLTHQTSVGIAEPLGDVSATP